MSTNVVLLLLGGGGLIGVLLAMLGAGGGILLLPLLVSGAALPTREAVPLSLLVVTLMALGNLGPYLRRRQVAPKPALIMGVSALAGSWIGGSLVKAGLVAEPVQLGLFAAAALLASWLLSRGKAVTATAERSGSGPPLALAVQGLLVGLLTGIAGVGGGFVGALVGQRLAPHLPDRQLRRGFAALLVGSALLSGIEVWRRQAPTANQTTHRPSVGSLGTTTGSPRTSPPLAAALAPQSMAPQSAQPLLQLPRVRPLAGNAPTKHRGDAGSAASHWREPPTPTPSTL